MLLGSLTCLMFSLYGGVERGGCGRSYRILEIPTYWVICWFWQDMRAAMLYHWLVT